jgi:hypothetical protein
MNPDHRPLRPSARPVAEIAGAGRRGIIGRIGLVGIVVATLLAVGAPVSAGPGPAANVHVTIGSPEVRGYAGSAANTVTLKLKRDGSVIASTTVTTQASGFFEVNLKPVRIGDKVVIGFQGQRTVTVPKVTLKGNAATDTVSGHLPKPGEADVEISNAVGSFSLSGAGTPTYLTDGKGDFSGSYPGLSGADRLELRWFNTTLDSFTVELAMTAVQAQVGASKAWLFGRPGTTVKAVLLASNGTVRGAATVTLPGSFPIAQATFRKNGSPVKAKAGDRIRIGTVTGLTLRTPDLVVSSTAATATCFPNQDWVIGTTFGAGAFSYLDDGTADGSGGVAASWASPLGSGTKVRLMCENGKGWTQDMTDTVP